ncbi:hypothetical protein [Jiulongibacter sediminis]|jgi:uncharacterized membrane protein (GlpM family)|uniref:hypothetical protein n=1 Tax=Jiulongibacter sediminis TaxID=1605367 RepID=UPI0026F13EEA|nr:hypothetical protein [Jiulongibacter sediminis]
MDTFWFKVLAMPTVIALVTLASRKWGNVIGGVIAGMPWVGGAILLFIALEQGEVFAVNAIPGALVGLICWLGFCSAYMIAGQRFKAFSSLLIGIAAFLLPGSILMNFTPLLPAEVWFVVLLTMIGVTLRFFPKVKGNDIGLSRKIRFDIPLRMIMITVFVVALTYFAKLLGPTWSGILTPFPVMTATLAVFVHIGQGMHQVRLTLVGMFTGVVGFATFLVSLVYLIPAFGIGWSFLLALLINVVAALSAKMLFSRLKIV